MVRSFAATTVFAFAVACCSSSPSSPPSLPADCTWHDVNDPTAGSPCDPVAACNDPGVPAPDCFLAGAAFGPQVWCCPAEVPRR